MPALLFPPDETPNRRMTPQEYEEELLLAKLFKRPPRSYIKDKPFYPYVPKNEQCMVNFDLNYPY